MGSEGIINEAFETDIEENENDIIPNNKRERRVVHDNIETKRVDMYEENKMNDCSNDIHVIHTVNTTDENIIKTNITKHNLVAKCFEDIGVDVHHQAIKTIDLVENHTTLTHSRDEEILCLKGCDGNDQISTSSEATINNNFNVAEIEKENSSDSKIENEVINTDSERGEIDHKNKELYNRKLQSSLQENEELQYKFKGPVFRSFREKPTRKHFHRNSSYEEYFLGWTLSIVSSAASKEDHCLLADAELQELKRKVRGWGGSRKEAAPELNRSQYSLVSCGDLTAGAVQLWLGLPEEVKYDPALAAFRQLYEKEHAKESVHKTQSKNGNHKVQRLPLVSSAPHLNNNLQVVAENVDFGNNEKSGGIEIQNIGNGRQEQHLENTMQHKRQTKMARARHYTKMTILLACWVFFTVIFLMYNEKEEIIRSSSVGPDETKNYILDVKSDKLTILIKLSGPFLTEQAEKKMNSTELENSHRMSVWLEKWTLRNGFNQTVNPADVVTKQTIKPWSIVLQDPSDLDFNQGEPRSTTLQIETNSTDIRPSVFVIRIRTSVNSTTPFTMGYTLDPLDIRTGVLYAFLLLCGLYILIIFEIINRTMAAVLLSTTSIAVLAIAGERPTVQEMISWLDVETLLLLFSMMLLVAITAETGIFDFLAVYTFEVTKGRLWPLITLLSAITAFLSTFLDNVTTVLLMTPVTIRLCEVMDLDPVPVLMSMVLFSNIGGTATPVGDPPNVIIASNKAVIQAGINFTNFTLHMTLGILLVCVQTYFQFRFIFRDTNKLRLNVPRDIQDLRHQISIWRRAVDSLPHLSKDHGVIRERLERKVKKLTVQLEALVKESSKRACPKDTFHSTLQELKDKYKIRDKVLLVKASVALSFVVALFFLHSIPELNRISLGWTALLGAILLLVLADREDLEPILHRVEWSTLLFFAALFVLMEALSKLGLIEFIGGLTESLILMVDESKRLAVALLLMLWVSGITSAFVDNIPLTTMMVRIVTSLGNNPEVNLPMAPLIWALSFGACLGGNGTLIGASANVVCAGVAEQHGYKISFMQFFKIGFPVMIGHLIIASGYLILCHCVFTWH